MSYPILYGAIERKLYPSVAGVAVVGRTIVGNTEEHGDPFSTMGLGTLTDVIECRVTEQRNGAFELFMRYPISGVHFSEIECRKIILAKPNYIDPTQPFRIYRISKPLNGICDIYAQHLSYDLNGYEMPVGKTATSVEDACTLLSGYGSPFDFVTDKTTMANFRTYEPSSVRSWLGGKAGSMLDVYGGEWQWNRYRCRLWDQRGTNRGVTIRYGKNLTALKQDIDYSNVYSGVIAYWQDSDGGTIVQGNRVSTGTVLDTTKTFYLDASGDFETQPSVAQLTARAASYANGNNLSAPKISLALDFVQMAGLRDRVDLCDTVTVIFEELGVSSTVKCIETTWDVLQERYLSTKFGEPIKNIADTLAELRKEK